MIIYHALRVWGPMAPFEEEDVGSSSALKGLFGKGLFVKILTDDQSYGEYSRFTLDHLLVESPFGVQVVGTGDAGWGQEWGSTHVGKYCQVMADLGMPTNTVVRLAGNRRSTLARIVEDEARRYHPNEEPEWIACGLSRYLSVVRWQNRFEQSVSFDDLATELVRLPFGQGPCWGTHVPNALATLLDAQEHAHILSQATETCVRERLGEYASHLKVHQQSDGSWSANWASGEAESRPDIEMASKIAVTGHHLEWMMICPPNLRPPPPSLDSAARFLVRHILNMEDLIGRDFHFYAPASHAARALLLASGKLWAEPSWIKD